MIEFFRSFIPIVKHLKKHKLDSIFIFIALVLTIISTIIFFSSTHLNRSDDPIVINQNLNSLPQKKIFVDIGGAVNKPDLYEISSGARLKQVITLAGGLSEQAHKDFFTRNFNLARIISDQEKIYVPSIAEINNNIIVENQQTLDYSLPTNNTSIEQPVSSNNYLININNASADELDTLPGIGLATAQKIIQNRPYQSVEELLSRKIVKSNIYEQIKNSVTTN